MAANDIVSSSQIPGLSHLPDDDEDDAKRRNYIKESDSEYVKLAKQGGIKGLLSIEQEADMSSEAVGYPKSDWFGHHSMDKDDQEKILSERKWKAPDYMTYDNGDGAKARKAVNSSVENEKPRALTAREERMLIQAKYNNREVPYQSDNLSCWERKEEAPLRSRLHK